MWDNKDKITLIPSYLIRELEEIDYWDDAKGSQRPKNRNVVDLINIIVLELFINKRVNLLPHWESLFDFLARSISYALDWTRNLLNLQIF